MENNNCSYSLYAIYMYLGTMIIIVIYDQNLFRCIILYNVVSILNSRNLNTYILRIYIYIYNII